jgi:hypothetical protein
MQVQHPLQKQQQQQQLAVTCLQQQGLGQLQQRQLVQAAWLVLQQQGRALSSQLVGPDLE